MSLPEVQARVKAKVWQAVARSGVNVSSIPESDMEVLVSTITESVLQEMDQVLGEADTAPGASAAETAGLEDEQLLWEGRPFLSISTHYQITTERVRIMEGVLGKTREDIELARVQDIDQTQSFGERVLDLGDIHIRSHDPSSPQVTLRNIANPQEVHEILRKAVLNARKRHGVRFREEM